MRNLTAVEMTHHVQVGQVWIDIDMRNPDRGKTGKAKPKYRTVEIVSLPTPTSPGTMRALTAPKARHTIGKLREFSYGKLLSNYARG